MTDRGKTGITKADAIGFLSGKYKRIINGAGLHKNRLHFRVERGIILTKKESRAQYVEIMDSG